MPFYHDTKQLYAVLQTLFARIGQNSPHVADGIL